MRPSSVRKPRVSAGTGVASAWWKSLHGGLWLLLLGAIAVLLWWAWH